MRLLFLLLVSICARGQMQTDPGKAFLQARAEGKKVLLVFSGSDWCMPCIHLEKKVLSDSAFLEFAAKRLVMLRADFPQRKKRDASLSRQYDSLAERFNSEGAFPKIVLVNPDKKLVATLAYNGQSPCDLIREIDRALQEGSSTD